MTQAIFKVGLFLLSLTLGISTLALWLGRQSEPLTVNSAQFGLNTCQLPCWAGITPGVTRFDDAARLLKDNVPSIDRQLLMSGSQINFWVRENQEEFSGMVYSGLVFYDQGNVGDVRLNINLPIWYLIDTLGKPECTWSRPASANGANLMVIYWKRQGISIGAVLLTASQKALSPGTKAGAIFINLDTEACTIQDTRPWPGFVRPWRYASG